MRWVRLCTAAEVKESGVKRVEVEGCYELAVYRVGGRFYATDDRCTHGNASLSEGLVDGDLIECPFHGGTFHIPTGRPVDPPCVVPVKTYPIRVEGEEVFVELEAGPRM